MPNVKFSTENQPKKRGRPFNNTVANRVRNRYIAYFARCKKECKPFTKSGLARALGYTAWQQVEHNIENNIEIKAELEIARVRLREYWESKLDGSVPAAGVIFWHKNDGWKDIQEVKVNDEQSKAISAVQREAALQLVERRVLSTSLPSSDLVQGTVSSSIVEHPEKRDIGRSDISTEFTSDNVTLKCQAVGSDGAIDWPEDSDTQGVVVG
jgi:hypothetical protein